jgi:hypothetical protein
MAVKWFMIYVVVQWITSLIIGYTITSQSFAKTQIIKMRKTSFLCLVLIALLSILGYYDFLQSPIWGYLILPIIAGLIIVSILYSTLTSLFVIIATHELKTKQKNILKTISILFLPIGIFLLKARNEYSSNHLNG